MNTFSPQPKHPQRGQVLLGFVLMFLAVSLVLIVGANNAMLSQIQMTQQQMDSFESFATAESASEDMVYRTMQGMNTSPTERLSLNNATATTGSVTTAGQVEITAESDKNDLFRSVKVVLTEGSGVSFNYGIQAGRGGFRLENKAQVEGNVYSNGSVEGADNTIKGTVVSAGSSGLIDGIHATGSAYANTIQDSTVDKDAFYKNISNTTVGGTKYPDSDDQPTTTLPISDSQIQDWQDGAVGGGIISSPCPYEIDSNETIGPVKIDCDLIVKGNNITVTLGGPIWVNGDITIRNGPTIEVASSLGSTSVPVIADDEAASSTEGTITLRNKSTYQGPSGSYILMLSENTSAENGGSTDAITVENQAKGKLLVYAGHGEILLENSVDLTEVTAYRIRAKNTATVVYESGLANLVFDSGPSGGFEIISWDEVE